MLRTQISLTDRERRALDAEALRTGRSISALIRDAVDAMYDTDSSPEEDLAAMRVARGAWAGREDDGAAWVESMRSGARLERVDP